MNESTGELMFQYLGIHGLSCSTLPMAGGPTQGFLHSSTPVMIRVHTCNAISYDVIIATS